MTETNREGSSHDGGPLEAHRARVLYTLAGIAVPLFLPFVVNNFAEGRYLVGAGSSSLVLILASNAWASWRKKTARVPIALIIVPAIPSLILASRQQGFGALMWSFPLLLLLNFLLSVRVAVMLSVVLIAAVAPAAWAAAGRDTALRFVATLVCTGVLTALLLRIIDEQQKKLARQTIIDPLTGAYNVRHMQTRLCQAIDRHRRTQAPASLLLVDIDHFKRINDEQGHAIGDQVLRGVVETIQTRIRVLDELFRLGGEEFVVFLPDTREEGSTALAERLRAAIAQAPLLAGRRVTVSIGVSELRADDALLDSWVRRADEAMYSAKENGRDRVVTATAAVASAGTSAAS